MRSNQCDGFFRRHTCNAMDDASGFDQRYRSGFTGDLTWVFWLAGSRAGV